MESARSRMGRSRREGPRSDSISRRRSASCPPSATRVHMEEDKHMSMGRVSSKSAKKGRISDHLYVVVQERSLKVCCDREGRSVEYALEQVVISAALDEQALDLDFRDNLDVSLISIDEAS